MRSSFIVWQRLDRPGRESAVLEHRSGRWVLSGVAEFEHESLATRLEYTVVCDDAWRTVSATVLGTVGAGEVDYRVDVVSPGRWLFDGYPAPAVDGAIDVDLNFSPSTNLLPIRRLGLAVGEEATVRAAWLRFPSFKLEALDQTYRRTGESTYRYESAGGSFVRDLEVNGDGFVVDYPEFWKAEE